MEATAAYLARDRHEAMARGAELPERTAGAALFADISGFTPLTEALTRELGARRGVEELTGHLNRVYDALVAEVHAFGGSIIHFAGDAITCWFDGDDGLRAVASGLAMQSAMARQPEVRLGSERPVTLSLKVGIAVGRVRRFAVGDPAVQRIDVLAGCTLGDMAAAANAAGRGEVLMAGLTGEEGISERLELGEARGPMRVVHGVRVRVEPTPWPAPPPLADAVVRPWLLPAVFERMAAGRGEFLTELRPAVAVFLKFGGIDYDEDDEAGTKLDRFVRWIQGVVGPYEGFLHHVSVGDKGSYLYCTFGAPIAHEDDTVRALAAALELRLPPEDLGFHPEPRIGISEGTLRTGAYGGTERRTYGVLGDEVNLAARLMEHARAGEVVVSGRTREASRTAFTWDSSASISLKGKARPVEVFRLRDRAEEDGIEFLEPLHGLPMVGRKRECAVLEALLGHAAAGQGQVVEILGEAGMGKSRLVIEVVRMARERGFEVLGGQAQSIGTNTSYLAWWSVWRRFFHVPRQATPEEQAAVVGAELLGMNPALLVRLPLLGAVFNLEFPENDVTRPLDGKVRKASLESLLVECLRRRSEQTPLLVVIEDGHWLDPLSQDLLSVLAHAAGFFRVMLLVASRPPDGQAAEPAGWRRLPHATVVSLGELSPEEAREFIGLKLAQVGGSGAVPDPAVVARLEARSQGNPFYLEELIHFLRDQGLNPNDARAWENVELPNSLQSLILGRMDRLAERRKPTLKVASVIGRVFEPSTISAIYPVLAEADVKSDLGEFERLELTLQERPEPQLAFIFKHVVTQEVAYETLSYLTRARLHGELGAFLERRHAASLEQHLDLLAFHYDRSDREEKRRQYLLAAANAAQSRYANAAAISYYRRVLPLLQRGERIGPQLNLGRVLETVGDWLAALDTYRGVIVLGEELGDTAAVARARTALAELHRKQGAYAEATRELDLARDLFLKMGDEAGVAQTLHYAGSIAAQQGAYERARTLYHQSLEKRRGRDAAGVASLLSNLGIVAWFEGNFPEARRLYEESLAIRRELGNRWAIGNSLNNLGLVLRDMGDAAGARRLLEECVAINREIGDRWSVANALGSLADVVISQGDSGPARQFLVENLRINRELDDRTGLAFSLELFAQLAVMCGDGPLAVRLVAAAGKLREDIGAPLSPSEQGRLDQALRPVMETLEGVDRLRSEGREMGLAAALELALAPGDGRR